MPEDTFSHGAARMVLVFIDIALVKQFNECAQYMFCYLHFPDFSLLYMSQSL